MTFSGEIAYINDEGKWKQIPSPEKLAQEIVDVINYYKNVASKNYEKAVKTQEEVRAEIKDEVAELKAELARMPFIFTKTEAERYYSFRRKHYSRGCDCNKGFSISFVGDGIGTSYEVICNHCGKRENITDEESW